MNDITILYDMPIHTDREISANPVLTLSSRTIGIRNALSLMWLYPLIKIPPKRFPKNFPSIKIWKSKLAENLADEDRNNSSRCRCVRD